MPQIDINEDFVPYLARRSKGMTANMSLYPAEDAQRPLTGFVW